MIWQQKELPGGPPWMIVYLTLTPPLRTSTMISQRLYQHLTATWWTQEFWGLPSHSRTAPLPPHLLFSSSRSTNVDENLRCLPGTQEKLWEEVGFSLSISDSKVKTQPGTKGGEAESISPALTLLSQRLPLSLNEMATHMGWSMLGVRSWSLL